MKNNKKVLKIITFILDLIAVILLCLSLMFCLMSPVGEISPYTIVFLMAGVTFELTSTLVYKRFK